MGMRTAKPSLAPVLFGVVGMLCTDMFEVIQPAHDHVTPRSGTVVFKHMQERLKQEIKVLLRKPGTLSERR
jgi:hypothetical protein